MTSLIELAGEPRTEALRKKDAYFDGQAYEHLRFDWDGSIRGYGGAGAYVPMSERKPDVILGLPSLVVHRFTAFGFGLMPSISCPGDDETERFYHAVIREARLFAKLVQSRNLGGACGTAVASLAYVRGKPRVRVHRARNVHVLRWVDKYAQEVGHAIEVTPVTKGEQLSYHVREWTEETETVWEPVPVEVAKQDDWHRRVQSYTVNHGFGFCPVVWCQNLPTDDQEDGLADCESVLGNGIFDAVNRLASQDQRGLVANLDPTLVINVDGSTIASKNVKKGHGQAIFSEKGASYLELSGKSSELARAKLSDYRQHVLDSVGLVLPDEKIGASGLSAAALKIRYQPTIAASNLLRSQYADDWIRPVLQGLWRMAKIIGSKEPGELRTTDDGRVLQERPAIDLEPEMVDGEMVVPVPGDSPRLEVQWPEYFPVSPEEASKMVATANSARGSLVSDETAVRYTAGIFGVADTAEEVEAIQAEEDMRLDKLPSLDLGGGTMRDEEDAPESER